MKKHYREKLAPLHEWACDGYEGHFLAYTRGEARAAFKAAGKGLLNLSTVRKVGTRQMLRPEQVPPVVKVLTPPTPIPKV